MFVFSLLYKEQFALDKLHISNNSVSILVLFAVSHCVRFGNENVDHVDHVDFFWQL